MAPEIKRSVHHKSLVLLTENVLVNLPGLSRASGPDRSSGLRSPSCDGT